MNACVAYTHTIIWYLRADNRLSSTAKQFMDTAAGQAQKIAVSSISLVEIVYLVEKNRVPPAALTTLLAVLRDPKSMILEIPVNMAIAEVMMQVSATQIPDMPDRIVAATALYLNVPLISRDRKIRTSAVTTIW